MKVPNPSTTPVQQEEVKMLVGLWHEQACKENTGSGALAAALYTYLKDQMWAEDQADKTALTIQREATNISINIHNANQPAQNPAQKSIWEKISGILGHPFWKAISYIITALGFWLIGSH